MTTTRSTTERAGFAEMSNHKVAGARMINASEFKAKCLKMMDEVADNGEEIVITKNGRPVSRLVPRTSMDWRIGKSLWPA